MDLQAVGAMGLKAIEVLLHHGRVIRGTVPARTHGIMVLLEMEEITGLRMSPEIMLPMDGRIARPVDGRIPRLHRGRQVLL
jgi:hypothetical protein